MSGSLNVNEAVIVDGVDDPLLSVRDLSVRFGGLDVLSEVSLAVPRGRVVGLIGPNGAGKTTLFNVICGFIRATSGSLVFDGKELRGHRPHDLTSLGIARTLQGLGLFAGLSVLDNVLAGTTHLSRTRPIGALLAAPWVDRDERRLRAQAMTVLESLDIAADAERPCSSLPYGVRKRVALARALVSEPRLLLLDEPAAGLGADETVELASIVRRLSAETTVMLVEHHMDFVMGLCDSLVVLDFGQVIARGTPQAVQADPLVQQAYLGEPAEPAEPAGPRATGGEGSHA
jgi:branched-chain amino acid transport system ATP-binding protein